MHEDWRRMTCVNRLTKSCSRIIALNPTSPGQILDDRFKTSDQILDKFKTIAELGFRAGSTLWLTENLAL